MLLSIFLLQRLGKVLKQHCCVSIGIRDRLLSELLKLLRIEDVETRELRVEEVEDDRKEEEKVKESHLVVVCRS